MLNKLQLKEITVAPSHFGISFQVTLLNLARQGALQNNNETCTHFNLKAHQLSLVDFGYRDATKLKGFATEIFWESKI